MTLGDVETVDCAICSIGVDKTRLEDLGLCPQCWFVWIGRFEDEQDRAHARKVTKGRIERGTTTED